MKDEPCRCTEDGLQSPHQIKWDTDVHTVAIVEPVFLCSLVVLSMTPYSTAPEHTKGLYIPSTKNLVSSANVAI